MFLEYVVLSPAVRRYLDAALQICQTVQAYNSDVYSRCVHALSYYSDDTDELIELQKNLANASEYPYYPVTMVTPDAFTVLRVSGGKSASISETKNGSSAEGPPRVSQGGEPAKLVMRRNPNSLQQQLPVSIRNLARASTGNSLSLSLGASTHPLHINSVLQLVGYHCCTHAV